MPIALIALLILSLCSAVAQTTHPLTGRQIAPVMSASGSGWLDRPERESEEAPDKAIELLGLRAGMTVADVGAGTGYMTFRMAQRIGPTGKAYAEDLQPQMLEKLRAKAQREKVTNIETVLGTVNDPKLPAGQIDLVLLVDVYHEFSEPQAMLDRIRESLKPDGRLVLLEYRKEDPKIPIRLEHKMSVAEVKTEVEAEGYKLDEVIEKLPRQHIIIFKVVGGRQ
ncbi:MAG TPA: methyltransferase domain-containing protein [Bryobacteraceae bacterium]|nr:methyltransferase domain-containing protein [Bryobacteraceae bacterium]